MRECDGRSDEGWKLEAERNGRDSSELLHQRLWHWLISLASFEILEINFVLPIFDWPCRGRDHCPDDRQQIKFSFLPAIP
jgi:hypothetical protein